MHFTPELEKKLAELAAQSGQETHEVVENLVASCVDELADVRTMLNCRYDDIKSGRVKPIDGETFFEALRQREEDLLKRSTR